MRARNLIIQNCTQCIGPLFLRPAMGLKSGLILLQVVLKQSSSNTVNAFPNSAQIRDTDRSQT